MKKIDLIIHPVRLRILQTLAADSHTTQEIALLLPDVPKSSIYRHLKILLEGDLVEVAETQLVRGIQEKTYQLSQTPHLGPDDMAGLTVESHMRYFTTYFMTVLKGFADYLEASEAENGKVDMLADRSGYTEVTFYATPEELNAFQGAINEAFLELMGNKSAPGRNRHKFALVTHPIKS